MKKKLLISFCVLCHFFINAQNPVSRNLTTQNGLPSNTVYNILQDSKGFIWLGHDKGLSRYDGNTFTHFTAPAQQGKSVSNLLENNNEIWCQDFSGNFYYTQNDSLKKEINFKTTGTYSAGGILKKQILTVINYDSLRSFDIINKKNLKTKAQLSSKRAVFYSNYFAYFFCANSLKRFNGEEIEVLQRFNKPLPNFTFLIKVKNTFIAFNKDNYPLAYKINNHSIQPLSILKNGLLIQDVNVIGDEIWISTTSGAYCFDKNLHPLYNGQCFFAENSITKIIKDRENNYWFGTLNKGILIVPDINVKLYKYSTESITALSSYDNNDEVLAGTSSNLIFAFNSKTSTFNTIISNETKGEIFSLYYDKPLKKIITFGNSVSFYQNGKKVGNKALGGKAISAINEYTFCVAYSGGIALLPRKNNKIEAPVWLQKYIYTTDNLNLLAENYRGRVVLFDSTTQTLYTATSQGLKYYNEGGSKFILFNEKPIYASSLCIVNGFLYAGTFSDGLFKIQQNNAELINSKNNNLANTVYKLYADSSNLWLSSDELIQCYNTITGNLYSYTSADGLPKAEVKDILIQNSKVYVATTDGLVVFNTNKNSVNKIQPLLQLIKFLVNDKEVSITKALKLNYNENNIELFLSLLSFKDNAASVIRYRINKGDWKILPNGVRNIQLPSLAAGKYTIEINALNEDGVAAEKNISVTFSIDAPFYKKLWFIILVCGLLFLAMYIYFRQRLKSEKKSNELLAQKIQLEQELHQSMLSSIKSQMNPHFLFNALNTVQSYIYTNEKENASLYLGKFSELTRTILDMSNKDRVTIAEEIKALQLYVELEQLRFEDKLQYYFEIDKHISIETTYIPSMLIQPYVENAIKHGLMHQKNQWKLLIAFKLNKNSIEVTIDDNGVGRKASEAINQQRSKGHQSFASSANQKRLDILNKGLPQSISLNIIDKVDEHGYSTGTTMILNIPFLDRS